MSLAARLLQTRWFVRAPIGMFRARLGFLFAGRMLLLEHVGRKSGNARYVVLETVDRPADDRVIIASGFGEHSQWFRNLQADPHCHVSIGWSHHRPATARVMDADESATVIDGYRTKHPKTYDKLSAVMEESAGLTMDEVPLVELSMS